MISKASLYIELEKRAELISTERLLQIICDYFSTDELEEFLNFVKQELEEEDDE